MTVYVVYSYAAYEGCSQPLKAFSTQDAASAWCRECERTKNSWGNTYDYEVLTVDA